MTWADIEAAVTDGTLGAFGEPIVLPGGVAATAIFEPLGQPALQIGELTGMDARLLQDPQPVLRISAGDGAALVEGDWITVRGVNYLVSRIDDSDGSGLLRVELYRPRDHQ